MYVYLLCQILQKSETSAKLKNSKNTNKILIANKQPSKLCNASQVVKSFADHDLTLCQCQKSKRCSVVAVVFCKLIRVGLLKAWINLNHYLN